MNHDWTVTIDGIIKARVLYRFQYHNCPREFRDGEMQKRVMTLFDREICYIAGIGAIE
jgi:hypothetical protein